MAHVEQPRTDAQWQEAVNLAHAFLLIESAKRYGLITGGPTVNVDRCAELLRMGEARGFRPKESDGVTQQVTRALA